MMLASPCLIHITMKGPRGNWHGKARLQGSKIGRHWRFTERDLEQFLERQRPTRHTETAL